MSHLGIALGVKAVKNGFSVTHFVLDELMHGEADAAVPPTRLKAKGYLNSALLVVDEVGFARWTATSQTSSSDCSRRGTSAAA